jgi:hypothetical protein
MVNIMRRSLVTQEGVSQAVAPSAALENHETPRMSTCQGSSGFLQIPYVDACQRPCFDENW